ncbi:TatD family hydrolase [Tannerella sp.]|uniref:TatD family hydrolase n=1 Tax=Tannerella sp. TaxID=2382127 RepID=UPI0026DAA36F|nr:TatD family hydrolase [Tannerella sp.]MDO4702907.1 TatD family hydrolase [Tannerella sp.]
MKWIDTHTHIYGQEFDADRKEMIDRAKRAGVYAALLPNIDAYSISALLRVCEENPGFAFPMMGLHPTSVDACYASQLMVVERALVKSDYCAIGEIGIDLYWDRSFLKEQKQVFEEQLKWSIDLGLAVSIHTREAYEEVFDSIYKVGHERLKGVFHCFSGTLEDLEEIKRMKGFKIGINGVVTFKKSALPEMIRTASLDMLLLETDAPYLAPVPYRGKRNEVAYLCETACKTAEIFGISMEELSAHTEKNALELFNILGGALGVEYK